MPAPKTKEELWAKAQTLMAEKGQWRKFYVSRMGCRLKSPHDDASAVAKLNGKEFKLSLETGEWLDAPDAANTPIHFLMKNHPRCLKVPKLALGEICCFVGLDADFLRICGEQTAPVKAKSDRTELVDLVKLDDPRILGRKIQIDVRVSGVGSAPYGSPNRFTMRCKLMGNKCDQCVQDTVYSVPDYHPMHLSQRYFDMPNRIRMLSTFVNCPRSVTRYCKPSGEVSYRVIWLRQGPQCGSSKTLDVERKACMIVNPGDEPPVEGRAYRVYGTVWTNPYDCYRMLMIEEMTPLDEDWEKQNAEEAQSHLEKIRKMGPHGVARELMLLAGLAGPDRVALLTLLTACSVRWMNFNGQRIRGWLVSSVVGNTSTGKSLCYEQLVKLLGTGETFRCANGRRTGLLFSTAQRGDEWRTQPGAYPRASRRILSIEELHNAPEMAEYAGDAMRTGEVCSDNVASARFEAETRVILFSNTKQNRGLKYYDCGCEAFADLFSARLLARIDLGLISDVRADSEFNRENQAKETPSLNADDFRALVFSAWLARPSAVEFDDAVTRFTLAMATDLAKRFGSDATLPLVPPSDIRNKLARIAAAWAILSGKMDARRHVVVTLEDVQAAADWMAENYSASNCKLDVYVRKQRGA